MRCAVGPGPTISTAGAGIDAALYSEGSIGVIVNLSTGTGSGGNAQGDILVDIESVFGSQGADRLTGTAGANGLFGAAGDDLLQGGRRRRPSRRRRRDRHRALHREHRRRGDQPRDRHRRSAAPPRATR